MDDVVGLVHASGLPDCLSGTVIFLPYLLVLLSVVREGILAAGVVQIFVLFLSCSSY